MIFIGERINTGFKDIKQAVIDKDPGPLQEWAKKQTAAGADYLLLDHNMCNNHNQTDEKHAPQLDQIFMGKRILLYIAGAQTHCALVNQAPNTHQHPHVPANQQEPVADQQRDINVWTGYIPFTDEDETDAQGKQRHAGYNALAVL